MVRKDLTSSQTSIDDSQIRSLPVESISQLLSLQAGITKGSSGELHIRGGRSTEIAYNVNGVSAINPFDFGRTVQISTNAVQELSVVSGTFNAEYGNALSGVVNTITKEGGSKYTATLSYYTGDYISSSTNIFIISMILIQLTIRLLREHLAVRFHCWKIILLSFFRADTIMIKVICME